jgi:hypothetical protein
VQQILSGNAADLRIHHYIVRESLGRGGMGEVVKAWNPVLCRHEAIKKVLVTATKSRLPAKTGVTLLAMQRFEQEARVLAQLNQPSITTIYHAGFEGDVAFIAMEYVKGKTLRALVQEAENSRKPLEVGWVVQQMIATSRALLHAHEREVIHRDIKPGNIMITDDGSLKVLDMGIARLLSGGDGGDGAPLTQQAALGTPEVMPPEQWADAHSVTPASDIYSLGCTFFYLLTGRMPFPHTNPKALMIAHLNDAPPNVAELRRDVAPGLAAVIARMLAKEAEHRYKSCSELIAALEPFSESYRPPAARSAWVYLVAAGVVAAGVVVAVLLMGQPSTPTPPIPVFGETEFAAWLAEHRQQNAGTWASASMAEQFAASLPGDIGWADKKNLFAKETERRRLLQEQGRYWLKQHQEANGRVWRDLASIERFAAETDGFASLTDQSAVEQLKSRVAAETARLWVAVAHQEIDKFRSDNPDVWPDAKSLEAFAEGVAPAAKVSDAEQLRAMLEAVGAETWRRRRDRWLEQEQTQFALVWPERNALVGFADQAGPQVRDAAALDKLKSIVEKETQNRVRAVAVRWLTELGPEASRLEKELVPLLNSVRTLSDSARTAVDEPSFQQLLAGTKLVSSDAATVLGNRDVRLGNDRTVNYHASVFVATYRWLLGALSLPERRQADVINVRTLVDGKPALKVPLTEAFSLVATAQKGGYLTVVVFGNDGEQLVFLRPQAVRAGEEVYLLRDVPATKVGTDRIAVFLTSSDPLVEVPPPPANVAPPEVVDGNQMYELVPDQLDQLRKLYKFPSTFDRIVRHLWAGSVPAFIPPNTNVAYWGHKNFELSVVP